VYGKPEPGKKLFREVSEGDHQEKVLKGIAFGIVVTGLLCVLFLLVIPAFEDGSSKKAGSQPGSTLTETSPASVPPLKILNWRLINIGSAYVEGEAQNTSSRVLRYAEVWAYFYDAKGRRIWEGLANTFDLGPGMVWRFRIHCLKDEWEVSQAEVKVGSWGFR
jgi:hypothetical protein